MNDNKWKEIVEIDTKKFTETRLQVHYAIQIPSLVARCLLPKKEDDSHTNLGLIEETNILSSHLINNSFSVGVDLAKLRVVVLDKNNKILNEYELDKHTFEEGFSWLKNEITKFVDTTAVVADSHYEIPTHPIAKGAHFNYDKKSCSVLADYFVNADTVIKQFVKNIPVAHPVRCWPHHFDIGTFIPYTDLKSIGIGLSPGDNYYEEPYFYFSPYYKKINKTQLPTLAKGQWHNDPSFFSAILTAKNILNATDQKQIVLDYLKSVLKTSKELLDL